MKGTEQIFPAVREYLDKHNHKRYVTSKNPNYTITKFIWFFFFQIFENLTKNDSTFTKKKNRRSCICIIVSFKDNRRHSDPIVSGISLVTLESKRTWSHQFVIRFCDSPLLLNTRESFTIGWSSRTTDVFLCKFQTFVPYVAYLSLAYLCHIIYQPRQVRAFSSRAQFWL